MSQWLYFWFIDYKPNSNPSARGFLSSCRSQTGNGYWVYEKLENVMCKEGSTKPTLEAKSESIAAFKMLDMSMLFVITRTAGTQGLQHPANLY